VEKPFSLGGTEIIPLPVPHGRTTTYGYLLVRNGRRLMAYISDCKEVPESVRQLITGVDTLVLDALRYREHPTHMNVAEAIETAGAIRPRESLLTHLCHELSHAKLEAELPKVTDVAQAQALRDLIANRKLTSRAQDDTLKHVAKIPGVEALAKGVIEKASKVAWHDSRIIRAYRDWIAWLFAFGLIGLGMQITVAALKQAGGKPLVIGGVVGTVKAVGSLIVVLLFVREFV
jgi:hypothetical protein